MSKISYVMTVFNSEETLQRTIDSLLRILDEESELIIIDDGSTDRSKEICNKYLIKHENIAYYCYENHGVSFARNEGIKHANGDYLVFLDSDDEVLEKYYDKLIENDVDLVIYNYLVFSDSRIPTSKKISNLVGTYSADALRNIMITLYQDRLITTLWNKLFCTKIVKNNCIRFDEKQKIGEDTCFVLMYLRHCEKVQIIDKTVYKYFLYGNVENTLSSRPSKDYYIDQTKVLNSIQQYLLECGTINVKQKKFLNNEFISMVNVDLIKYAKFLNNENDIRSRLFERFEIWNKDLAKVRFSTLIKSRTKQAVIPIMIKLRLYRMLFAMLSKKYYK